MPDIPPFDLPLNSIAGVNHLQARLRSLELKSVSRAQVSNTRSLTEQQLQTSKSTSHSRTRSRARTDPSVPPPPKYTSLRRADIRPKRVIGPKSEKSPRTSRRLDFDVAESGDDVRAAIEEPTKQSASIDTAERSPTVSLAVPQSPGTSHGIRLKRIPHHQSTPESSRTVSGSCGESKECSFSPEIRRNTVTKQSHVEPKGQNSPASTSTHVRVNHKNDVSYGNDAIREEISKEKSNFSQHLGLGFFASEFTRPLAHPTADETPEERVANFFKVPVKFEQVR